MTFTFFYSCTGRWAGLNSAQIIDKAFLRGRPIPSLPEVSINIPDNLPIIFSATSTIHQGKSIGYFRIDKNTEIGWVSVGYQKVFAANVKHLLAFSGKRIVFCPYRKTMDYALKFWKDT